MRELKFRAWDIDNKQFVYAHIGQDDVWLDDGISTIEMPFHHSDFEQYTGLKDKNGKEIYEGDILHNKVGGINYVVSYCAYKGRYEMWNKDGYGGGIADIQPPKEFGIEVIGNIHENPELLGKEKKNEQN